MSVEHLRIDARFDQGTFAFEINETIDVDTCTAVFGPSGSGKSTLLRLIAGFEKPRSGVIVHGSTVWCDMEKRIFIPAHRRGVALMGQKASLFPHLTVLENLLYAERRSQDRRERFSLTEVVEAFDLGAFLSRGIAGLSGGEYQRVALGRTVLSRPDLLLLDEPLAALDRDRKSAIIPYLQDLPARFSMPVILVSHDVEEVSRLADQMLLLSGGQVAATGPVPAVLEAYGAAEPFGTFLPGTVLAGKVVKSDPFYGLTHVDIGVATLTLPLLRNRHPGDDVSIRIDPQNVALAIDRLPQTSIRNIVPGTVIEIESDGSSHLARVTISMGQRSIAALVTRASVDDLALAPGKPVYALIKTASFHD